jgi:hypothetical protein
MVASRATIYIAQQMSHFAGKSKNFARMGLKLWRLPPCCGVTASGYSKPMVQKSEAYSGDLSESAWIIARLKSLVERCMQAEQVLDRKGEWTGEYKFEPATALKALELLGKHHGMFERPMARDEGEALSPEALDATIQAMVHELGFCLIPAVMAEDRGKNHDA